MKMEDNNIKFLDKLKGELYLVLHNFYLNGKTPDYIKSNPRIVKNVLKNMVVIKSTMLTKRF